MIFFNFQEDFGEGSNVGLNHITKKLFQSPSPTQTSTLAQEMNKQLNFQTCLINAEILETPTKANYKGKGLSKEGRPSTQRAPKYHVPRVSNNETHLLAPK